MTQLTRKRERAEKRLQVLQGQERNLLKQRERAGSKKERRARMRCEEQQIEAGVGSGNGTESGVVAPKAVGLEPMIID